MRIFGIVVTLLLIPAFAGVTEQAAFRYENGFLDYQFSASLEGSNKTVYDVITDYDHLERLNNHIYESRILTRYGPYSLKRLIEMKYCVLRFCFNLTFVETVEETADTVTATIVPEESTFKKGFVEWRIVPVSESHTRLEVRAKQAPDFWIPPLIGPAILKRLFLQEVRDTVTNLERVVKATAPAHP